MSFFSSFVKTASDKTEPLMQVGAVAVVTGTATNADGSPSDITVASLMKTVQAEADVDLDALKEQAEKEAKDAAGDLADAVGSELGVPNLGFTLFLLKVVACCSVACPCLPIDKLIPMPAVPGVPEVPEVPGLPAVPGMP